MDRIKSPVEAVAALADPPTPMKARLDFAQNVLQLVGFAATGVAAAGWAARALGWLPAALEPFRLPVLALGSVALILAGGFPAVRQLFGPRHLRWTRAAAALSIGAVLLTEAGTVARAWTEDAALAGLLFAFVAIGVALLIDAREALQARSLPPLGIAGAAAGGVGILVLIGSMVAGVGNWLFLAAMPLLALAGAAWFRVRAQMAAEAIRVSSTESTGMAGDR